MKERVLKILAEVNEDILHFEGSSLIDAGLLDSFQVIDLVGMLEEEFDIEIDAELVIVENFVSVDAITDMVSSILS